jgi:hypothetical protein
VIFDCEIAAFVARVLEPLPDRRDLSMIDLTAQQQTDQRHRRLLRMRCERPRRRAAERG